MSWPRLNVGNLYFLAALPGAVLDDAARVHLLADAVYDEHEVRDVGRLVTGAGVQAVATVHLVPSWVQVGIKVGTCLLHI